MQKLVYRLEKDDYLNWIHWNVGRRDMTKAKRMTWIIFLLFLALNVGAGISSGNPAAVAGGLVMGGLVGGMMFYTISPKSQERSIWKRSGLEKLEKTNSFPTVTLTLKETEIEMEVPDQMHETYSYAEISEIVEIERMFLLSVSNRTWQFVAKSAFDSQEQMAEFKKMIEEKIEDAGTHPEKYKKAEQNGEKTEETEDTVNEIKDTEKETEQTEEA